MNPQSSDPIPASLALKEWAVAVTALTQGETILLLRKGGIRERGFTLAASQFWLYPTYEHQKPQWLKPAYAGQVEPVESGWHPEQVGISAWANVTHRFEIDQTAEVEALFPFHVWTDSFVTERLKWMPQRPLTALCLRVDRLTQPQVIPYRSEYGGCQSWIDLIDVPAPCNASSVLTETAYQAKISALEAVLQRQPSILSPLPFQN